jgi:trehalose synthase
MDIAEETVRTICERYGIDRDRPILCQVSPFDEAHNPIAAVQVFDQVRQEIPDLQLLLIATHVPQVQTARTYFDQVAAYAAERPNVFVLSELNYVGKVEINVCHRASDVAIQASLHRGYGIHIAESLWKERPAVGPSSGGIPELIVDGRTGFLANSVDDAADRVLTLLRDHDLTAGFGEAAREYVRGEFLVTRYLRDQLRMYQELMHGA